MTVKKIYIFHTASVERTGCCTFISQIYIRLNNQINFLCTDHCHKIILIWTFFFRRLLHFPSMGDINIYNCTNLFNTNNCARIRKSM